MSKSEMTRGQLERMLAQRIQGLYRNELGHQPGKVTCELFNRKLAVVIEDSVTKPERLLVEEGRENLAKQVRSDLDEALQPRIKDLIEEILQVDVLDLLSDATLGTGRSGAIAILASNPQVRNPT